LLDFACCSGINKSKDALAMDAVIGIDLGTTFSVVCYYDWETDRPAVIPNRQAQRTTPSMVSYFRGDVLVGDEARSKAGVNPAATIYNSKRIIGRRFHELRRSDLDSWPFKVVCDASSGLPRYAIDEGNGSPPTLVSAEEVAALVLIELRDAAEAFLQREVTKCVITVPAYFNAEQKRATRDAGDIAGLDVLAIIAEPTAAALAYGLDDKTLEGDAFRRKVAVDGWYILVFDLGGGTLDVCVLRLDGRGGFAQCAVTGDSHLGGEDFDTRLETAVERRMAAEFPDVGLNFKSRRRLRTECERVKRMLSTATETTLDVDLQGVDVTYDVSRSDFEGACGDLFDRALQVALEAVQLARLRPDDIDEVVLVGGSTRIPKLRAMLAEAFRGRPQWNGINPDEAVAMGAATFAATQYLATLDAEAVDIGAMMEAATPAASTRGTRHVGLVSSPDDQFQSVPPTPSYGRPATSPPAPPPPPPPAPATKVVVMPPGSRPGMPPPQHIPLSAAHSVAPTPLAAGRTTVATMQHHHGGAAPPPATAGAKPSPIPPMPKAIAVRMGRPPGPAAVPPKPAGNGTRLARAADVVLSNVATHTLGIALAGGEVDPLIPRGTPLPVSRTDRYTTQKDNQGVVTIKIVEGDEHVAKDNRTLKKFALKVPAAPAGVPQILVTFKLSADGILTVMAKDEQTGHRHTITVEGAGTMDRAERREKRKKVAEATGKTRRPAATGKAQGDENHRQAGGSSSKARSASQRTRSTSRANSENEL
jgi:molecular chaperone DnaK (HSP70)